MNYLRMSPMHAVKEAQGNRCILFWQFFQTMDKKQLSSRPSIPADITNLFLGQTIVLPTTSDSPAIRRVILGPLLKRITQKNSKYAQQRQVRIPYCYARMDVFESK